jgi:enterochelin esterase-like enzyme
MDSLRSANLNLPMEFQVYLPPCYDEQPDRRYPVLFLIHGQNYNEDQWDRLGADETANTLIAQGAVSPFLIVMPRDRYWTQPTESTFGSVLVEELIPLIDSRYRTVPERPSRAIGGLSRGASWSIHLGLSRWEHFGIIGAHSLPVFWSDTRQVRSWLDAIPPEQLPRIFMDSGEKDYLLESTLWFENLLTEKGIPHEWYLFPGYHEEAYWQSHLEQYLRFYAAEW